MLARIYDRSRSHRAELRAPEALRLRARPRTMGVGAHRGGLRAGEGLVRHYRGARLAAVEFESTQKRKQIVHQGPLTQKICFQRRLHVRSTGFVLPEKPNRRARRRDFSSDDGTPKGNKALPSRRGSRLLKDRREQVLYERLASGVRASKDAAKETFQALRVRQSSKVRRISAPGDCTDEDVLPAAPPRRPRCGGPTLDRPLRRAGGEALLQRSVKCFFSCIVRIKEDTDCLQSVFTRTRLVSQDGQLGSCASGKFAFAIRRHQAN